MCEDTVFVCIRDDKQETSKFSECTTSYQIYCMSCRHDPGNANGGVSPLSRLGGIWMRPVHGGGCVQLCTYIALPSPAVFSWFQHHRWPVGLSTSRNVKFVFFWHSNFVAETLVVHSTDFIRFEYTDKDRKFAHCKNVAPNGQPT